MNAILKLEALLYPERAPVQRRAYRLASPYEQRVARVVAWWNEALERSRTRG